MGDPQDPQENADIKPETIDCYELIYMYKDKDIKFTLNGFYSRWKDGILNISRSPVSILYSNIQKNQSYGGEANLFCSIDPFGVNFGLSYVKSEALNVDDPANPLLKIDRGYAAFPTYSLLAGLYYILKPYDILFYLNNRIYIGMKETGYDQQDKIADSMPDYLPTYWRMDLDIKKIIGEKYEVHLQGRNLTNRKHYLPGIWGNENGIEAPGISVLLRVSYHL